MAPGDVEKCVLAVSSARNYGERVSALLLLTRVIQTGNFDAAQREQLFRAVGLELLSRLLVFDDAPSSLLEQQQQQHDDDYNHGPPERVLRSLATALLSALCTVPEFLSDPRLCDQVPMLLTALSTSEDFTGEAMATKNDALGCLLALSSHPVSCRGLVERGGMTVMCQLVASLTDGISSDERRRDFRDQVFSVISSVVNQLGAACWRHHHDSFHVLLNALARQLVEEERSQRKFTMCDAIRGILVSYPSTQQLLQSNRSTAPDQSSSSSATTTSPPPQQQQWHADFHRELLGILCFKLSDGQREPLLKLCATLVEKTGVSWALGTGGDRSQRMFFLLVQLCCVEVRMIVEDQSPEEVMRKSELAAACFVILEHAIRFLIQDDGRTINEQSITCVYQAITAAFGGILHFLGQVAERRRGLVNAIADNNNHPPESELERIFLLATVRATGAWLAEETAALREEVYQVLPFLVSLVRYPSNSLVERSNNDYETRIRDADTFLHFLLPGLGHLSVEDRGRAVLFEHRVPELLADRFATLWPAFLEEESSAVSSTALSTTRCVDQDDDEDDAEEASVAVTRLTGICSVLTNVVVLEADGVRERNPELLNHLKFLFRALPEIDRVGVGMAAGGASSLLLLRGKMATLGLLLLRRFLDGVKSTETAIYRFLSASVRFLWDAFTVDETSVGTGLAIASTYRRVWDELKESWYLGMQALSSCLPEMPWVGEFVVQSGWADQIVATLCRVDESGVEASVKTAYEDFLCCVVQCYGRSADALLERGALGMCGTHKMKHLARMLRLANAGTGTTDSP